MKKRLSLLLAVYLLLSGCSTKAVPETTVATVSPTNAPEELSFSGVMDYANEEIPYVSRFDSETVIVLSDEGISVNGGGETDAVFTSQDIIYYEDKDAYESGYPYGEGEDSDKHTPEEAASHTVVNITAPGAYRVSGKLSAGQLRIDLGEKAYDDPNAVVKLILENTDITCTVAPAILFLNTYECDGAWSTDTAMPDVNTSGAGANLILEGKNTIYGSHVAKIFKDKEGEKKLWKQDGAIYSYMSMNVFGPGSLNLTAANEGLDTELHLTINGGNIAIYADNDGINTNEDGVSVTTINGGSLHIIAGLGEEGDGIDSNGYLVINGGTVVSSANPAADAGLDSDLGSYINGGIVLALGSTMDWAESESGQATMNLQFASYQDSGSAIVVTRQDGTVVFAYDPSEDEVLGQHTRHYMGAILSCPGFRVGESYHVYLDGVLTGEETGGIYASVNGYENGAQMAYTGTDLRGGMGGMMPPGGFEGQMPEGGFPGFGGEPPEGFEGEMPPEKPEDMEPGWMPTLPEGEPFPQGDVPEIPQGGFGGPGDRGHGSQSPIEANTRFFLADMVNAFSGVASAS